MAIQHVPRTGGRTAARAVLDGPLDRRTSKQLQSVDNQALVRAAGVRAEGFVQAEKVREINHLTREAMAGHALLAQFSCALAKGNPFLADELKFFLDMARVGCGQIIADTIETYSNESRGF